MQEMSLHEIAHVNGGGVLGFFVDYIAEKVVDWTISQAGQGNIDFAGYVNSNQNYWVGA